MLIFYRCAQNKIKKDEHDRKLERTRQKEELKAAQYRREMEADQQRHRQELEQKEHQKMLEIRERTQAEVEKQNKRLQDETERDCQHKRELQMEEVKTKGKIAEAEARIAEAKAKEANSVARAAEANVKSAEAEAKTAEANVKIAKAKAKEKEVELRSMLWKKYFDPETKMQDKQLIMEEIKRLTISLGEDQNVKKVPVAVKEIKVSKSKGDLVEVRPRRPWTTSKLPKPSQ